MKCKTALCEDWQRDINKIHFKFLFKSFYNFISCSVRFGFLRWQANDEDWYVFNLTFFVVLSDKICKPSPYSLCWSRHREEVWGETNISLTSLSSLRLSPVSPASGHQRSEAFSSPRDSKSASRGPAWPRTDCDCPNWDLVRPVGVQTEPRQSAGQSGLERSPSQNIVPALSLPPPVSAPVRPDWRWSRVFVTM